MKKQILAIALAALCAIGSANVFNPTTIMAADIAVTAEAINKTMERLEPFYGVNYTEYQIFDKNGAEITQKFYSDTYDSYVLGDWDAINTHMLQTAGRIERERVVDETDSLDLVIRKDTGLLQMMYGEKGTIYVVADVTGFVYYNPNTYVITMMDGPRVNYISGAPVYTGITTRNSKINNYKASFNVSFRVTGGDYPYDDFGYFNQSFTIEVS